MLSAVELMESHFDTLARDQAAWQLLIADELVWELPYAPSIGHPHKLEGRAQIVSFVSGFLKEAEGFRFHDLKINALANGTGAVAEVQATARILSTGRHYRQSYVVFLEARDGKIVHLREYFNPATAALALGAPIVELAAS
jgi:ketosteroid isomerase-like protein